MPNRRQFLWGGLAAAGGLAVGYAPVARKAAQRLPHAPPLGDPGWIHIATDNSIVIYTSLSELGQGIWTAIAQLVGEELEADWNQLQVKVAPSWRAYQPPVGFWTGGSTSVQRAFDSLRLIGACARSMLIDAAAQRWSVPATQCRAERGHVHHQPTARALTYGELAKAAAGMKAPAAPTLKPRSEWRLIGKAVPRIELASKVDGTAKFGMDIRLPGMLYAAIAQAPSPNATLQAADRAAARARPGVREVIDLPNGLAVVADHYWQAQAALSAAAPRWSPVDIDTQAIATRLLAMTAPANAQSTAATVDAQYEMPLLLHMQMEPLNATVLVERFSTQVWVPTQVQTDLRDAVAHALGQLEHAVTVHTPLVGGGFGRRLSTDDGVSAALVARHLRGTPVQVIWAREEDSLQGRFRPMSAVRLQASLATDGMIHAWQAQAASLGETARTGGLACDSYALPPLSVRYAGVSAPIRTGSWRSVDHSQNVFCRESFIDECAHAASVDPLHYRRRLLAGKPRALRVLSRLDELVQAGVTSSAARHVGFAFSGALGSFTAQAAEVAAEPGGSWRLLRVYAVVDCGTAVNPAQIRAQIEGGVLFGLSAALREQASFAAGQLRQANYDRYAVLRMADTPAIEVDILESPGAPLGGIGEAAVPLIAPALANAIFAATGQRLRRLPLLPTTG